MRASDQSSPEEAGKGIKVIIAITLESRHARSGEMLKLMTFNLNYYVDKYGNWEVRRNLILDQIQESRPDLIAFQAVKKEKNLFHGQDQASQIAQLAGYPNAVFQAAQVIGDGIAEGSAILSRNAPAEVDFLQLSLLPGTEDTNARVLMNCLFNFPTYDMRIFNAHFSWVAEQASHNIQEAITYVQSFQEPYLLVGDLNTQPDSDLLIPFQQAGMIDAWSELCPQESGFTFESVHPSMRIDYVWASPTLKDHLESIQVVGNKISPDGERPSDHLGLLVKLKD
jgi:endonuclease/exonuclease/phosphatase family metal-dependent hydrolase